MDIIQSIHNATDIKDIPQPGLPRRTGVQIQNRQGGAAGAHVDSIAPQNQVIFFSTAVKGNFCGRLGHLLADQLPGESHPGRSPIHDCASLFQHINGFGQSLQILTV